MGGIHCNRIKYRGKWRRYIPRHILKTIVYNVLLVIVHFVLISLSYDHKGKKVCQFRFISLVLVSRVSMYGT